MFTNILNLESPFSSRRMLFGLFGLLMLFSGLHTASAATLTWTGLGDGTSWSDGGNWNPIVAPVTGDDLVLPTGISLPSRQNMVNDLPGGTVIHSLTFQDNSYEIGPFGTVLHISSAINDDGVAGDNYIDNDLQLESPVTITTSSIGHDLRTYGAINLNGNNLLINGNGMFRVMSGINDSIIPSLAGVIVNSPNASIEADGNYQGQTVINSSGVLTVRSNNALGLADNSDLSGTIVNDGGGLVLHGSGNLHVPTEKLTLYGNGVGGNGVLSNAHNDVWDGDINLAADSRISPVVGALLTLNGNINGAGGIQKYEVGTLLLQGTNSYQGANHIHAGTLETASDTALGSLFSATDTYVENGATLMLGGGHTIINENLHLVGTGDSGAGALVGSGPVINDWHGAVTLDGDATFTVDDVNGTLRVDTAPITQSVASSLTKDGPGIMSVVGGSNYTGNTNILAGKLRTASADAIPNTSDVTITGGAVLDLNNNDETIARLLGDGDVHLGVAATPSTLTAVYNTDGVYNGVISGGHGAFTKDGPAVMTITNSNNYDGKTTISNGTLRLGGTGVLGDSTLLDIKATGIFDMQGNSETVGALQGDAGAQITSTGATLTAGGADADNTVSHSYAGVIAGPTGLTKTGPGKLILSGNNTYNGNTNVNGGYLIVNGSQVNSPINVVGGAVLGGSGTTGSVNLVPTAVIAPGNSTGILHTQGITFSAFPPGPVLSIEINGATLGTQYDQLNINGPANLGSTTSLQLTVDGAYTPVLGTPHVILQSTGPLTGTLLGLPENGLIPVGGKFFKIHYSSNSITLIGSNAAGDITPPAPPAPPVPSSPVSGGGSGGGSGSVKWPTSSPNSNNPGPTYVYGSNGPVMTSPGTQDQSQSDNSPSDLHPSADSSPAPVRVHSKYYLDVAGHRAEQDIYELLDSCKVAGYQDQSGNFLQVFRPDNQITRAELLTMIIKCKVGTLAAPQSAPFPDVPVNHWAAPYIAKALELGIIKGYDDGTFKPNNPVTKAEALKSILLSWTTLNEIESADTQNSCTDVQPQAWYSRYFTFALNNNLLSDTRTCQPETNISRADSASVVVKVRRHPLTVSGN